MVTPKQAGESLAIEPMTKERWDDFERLFGERGACGGCWCMYWRLTHREYEAQKGAGNRAAMKALIEAGDVPGLLAYRSGEPVGWISVAPREEFPRLARSRILKPVDDKPVWSVVCFFVDRAHRRQGLSTKLLNAASVYVREQGGELLEGYPVEPRKDHVPPVFAYTGLVSAFTKTGFEEVGRRSETRPIMRRSLTDRG